MIHNASGQVELPTKSDTSSRTIQPNELDSSMPFLFVKLLARNCFWNVGTCWNICMSMCSAGRVRAAATLKSSKMQRAGTSSLPA